MARAVARRRRSSLARRSSSPASSPASTSVRRPAAPSTGPLLARRPARSTRSVPRGSRWVLLRSPGRARRGRLPLCAGHLGGEQPEQDPVLVGGPDASVAAQEGGTGALLATEAERGVQQARDEPLEAHRHLEQRAALPGGDAVEQGRGHHRLADLGRGRPARAVLEQVRHGQRQEVVRRQQARLPGHDAVPVRIRVVAEGEVEAIPQLDQARHGRGRRAVHADAPVVIEGHEGEPRVDARVDDAQVQPVAVRDRLPVGDVGPAEGVDADHQARVADRLQVHHRRKVGHVAADVVVALGRSQGLLERNPPHRFRCAVEQLVGARLDRAGGLAAGRSSVRRVVLDAPVFGRVVGGGDHQAVGEAAAPAAVVGQDRVGDGGGGRVAVVGVDPDRDVVGDQHLEGGLERRLGQRMGVPAQEERAVDALGRANLADGPDHGGDVGLVEAVRERGAPVTRCAECNTLRRLRRVRPTGVVGGDQARDVDEVVGLGGPSGAGMHASSWSAADGPRWASAS